MYTRFVTSLLFALSATAVTAQLSNLPALTQPVNDIAQVIDADSARELDARIRALREATGTVVIIATVPTIAPYTSVDEYAVKLFEKAGIGERKLDNGLLILVAVKEHGIRVEVGYGIEATITDGFAGDTIRKFMVPEFRANRYGPGLLAGTTHLIEKLHPTGAISPDESTTTTTRSGSPLVLILVFSIVIIAGVIGLIVYRISKSKGKGRSTPAAAGVLGRKSRDDDDEDRGSSNSRSSDSSGSSSGSSFNGFGGGRSGGGGASGSW